MTLPQTFQIPPEALITFDYFSHITNVGYVNFYMAGGHSDADTKSYVLTTNSSVISDSQNNSENSSTTLNFDIVVEKSFTISGDADAFIKYSQRGNGAGGTIAVVWSISHISTVPATTVLGTVNGDQTANAYENKLSTLTLSRQVFKRGETLRLTAVISQAGNSPLYFDPSGFLTPDGVTTVNTSSFASIPIVAPL